MRELRAEMSQVSTVRGPVEVADLGPTYMLTANPAPAVRASTMSATQRFRIAAIPADGVGREVVAAGRCWRGELAACRGGAFAAGLGDRNLSARGPGSEVAVQSALFTEAGCERIMRFAFDLARTRTRRKVSSVTKSNAQQYGMCGGMRCSGASPGITRTWRPRACCSTRAEPLTAPRGTRPGRALACNRPGSGWSCARRPGARNTLAGR